MTVVRDPAFWRRFSIAVHMDEETATGGVSSSNSSTSSQGKSSPKALKHEDSWLDRQQRKRHRQTIICWSFWLVTAAIIAGVIVAIIFLKTSGILDRIHI